MFIKLFHGIPAKTGEGFDRLYELEFGKLGEYSCTNATRKESVYILFARLR